RQAALRAIEQLWKHVRSAIPKLVERFKDDDPDVCGAASAAFKELTLQGWMNTGVIGIHLQKYFLGIMISDAVPELLEMLKDPIYYVSDAAAIAFGQLAQYNWLQNAVRNVIPQILDIFKHSESSIRKAAAVAFFNMAQHAESNDSLKETLPAALEGLCYDQNETIVDPAAQVVSRLASD
ncbi:14129_t:CDS:2, partial [Acaulospora colombiana]